MRTLRWCVPAILATVALLVPGLARPSPADAVTQPVEILIEGVSPAIPQADDDLVITGRIANTSDVDIAFPRVQARLSPEQLNSRGEITEVLSGTTDRTGIPVPLTLTELGDTLAPGQQAQFRLTMPMEQLGLDPSLAGVFAVFVEALSGDVPLLESGTLFPWFPPKAKVKPTRLAWVWPITQKPAVAADELVVDPALPAEFGTDGRLGRLLTIGESYPVSWLIDSSTWQTASAMADGYQVQGANGAQPGDLTDEAAQFASRLQRIVRGNQTNAMQFAYADADALERGGLNRFVVRSASLPQLVTEQLAPGSRSTVVFDAPSGTSDRTTLETLVDTGLRELVLASRFFPPDPPVTFTPSGVTPVPVGATDVTGLLSDQALQRLLQRPLETAAERSRAKQEFLAQTALITLEVPTDSRSVVATPPELWAPPSAWLQRLLKACVKAPWLEFVGLDQVAQATSVPRLDMGYSDLTRRRELPQEWVGRIRALDEELQQLTRIVIDPTGYGETYALALQRAGSAHWRPDDSGRTEFLDTIDRQLDEQKHRVRVVSSGTVTLAGDTGVIPLTIANDLDRSVSVGVRLEADNPIALQSTAIDAVRVDAQEKAGVEVPVRVVSGQPLQVRVVLTDNEGGFYDDSAVLELRSTASSRIATAVAAVGGVALVILVILNLVRRRRAAPEPAEVSPDNDDTHV